jgi:DNA-binding NtrC family response regulator/CHASE2 domain-containing sensor protein
MKLEPTVKEILKICVIGFGIAIVTFLLTQHIGFFNTINDLLLDEFMIHSDDREPDQRLLVIERDDESVRQLGKPVPRSSYVKLIRKLSLMGAKTIVFDLLFIDEENATSDSELAAVTDSVRHVIHCFKFLDEEPEPDLLQDNTYEKYSLQIEDQTNLKFLTAQSGTFPQQNFINDFDQAGHITIEWDYDGRSRRMPLFYKFNNRFYPTLGLAALFDYYGISEKSITVENSFWGRNVIIQTPTEIIKIPIDSKGQMLLNFYGVFEVFEPAPLYEMINLLDAFQPRDPTQVSLSLFDEKIALIGTTETGEDKQETPFSADFPGVGFHATLISNILQGDFIREASCKVNALISAILTILLLGAFIYYQRFSKSILVFYIFPIAFFIIFNIIAYIVFFKYFSIWLRLIQIDSVYLVLFVAILFHEKVIRLKELNSKINQLEADILIKSSDLEKLTLKIDSQTEQYKSIEYIVTQLQGVLKEPAIAPQDNLKKVFPEFFKQYEIMKGSLEDKIKQLKSEKDKLRKEKEALETKKDFYEGILKGSEPTKTKTLLDTPAINKIKLAQQIMSAWQYYQSQQKRGTSQAYTTYGIVALTETLNEKGEKITTPMGEIIEKIIKISNYDSTVLITGEIGVGKELVAKAIYEQGNRSNKRLVTINCAAIPENLMESELFGHKKGAFTGANFDHKGAFEYANAGTIFLDEIGELKLDMQAKLLRVLQSNEIQKVGSNEAIKVDVRVLAATNKDLKKSIENNAFRGDLYSRLDVLDIYIPPLRDRKYDIPFLLQHFLSQFNHKYNQEKSFSSEAIIAALCYDWPNNIRSLEHAVEKACVLTTENEISLLALPGEIQDAYRDIFESQEVPWWSQIENLVYQEQKRLLEGCKTAIKKDSIDEFLKSKHLQADHKICANCYEYFRTFVAGIASIFSQDKRETLVRAAIVQMQEQLFQWCRQEKFAKLGDLYDGIEILLGRSRRQIDNWKKE